MTRWGRQSEHEAAELAPDVPMSESRLPPYRPTPEPAPESYEMAARVQHDSGPMHETAIRATALTAAVAHWSNTANPIERDPGVLAMADAFAHYIQTGERSQ